MTASNYRRRFFGDIELAEASAILEGIKLAEDLGLTPLVGARDMQ